MEASALTEEAEGADEYEATAQKSCCDEFHGVVCLHPGFLKLHLQLCANHC
jgi:hypothetical protein